MELWQITKGHCTSTSTVLVLTVSARHAIHDEGQMSMLDWLPRPQQR